MRIAHADLVHVVERVADVVDAGTAHADALRHQARAAVQVELAHVGRVRRVGDEGQRLHGLALDPDRDQARLVDAPRHLARPEPGERAPHLAAVDAERHAPARAAAAQAHHQPRLLRGAAVTAGEDAQRTVIAVHQADLAFRVRKIRRPHERAVAEDPKIAARNDGEELRWIHLPAL